MELCTLTSSSPAPPPTPGAGAAGAEIQGPARRPAQSSLDAGQQDQPQLTIEQHTLRYRVEGKQISVEVLDAEGRIVRSIPAEDLIKLRNRELIRPTLSLRG